MFLLFHHSIESKEIHLTLSRRLKNAQSHHNMLESKDHEEVSFPTWYSLHSRSFLDSWIHLILKFFYNSSKNNFCSRITNVKVNVFIITLYLCSLLFISFTSFIIMRRAGEKKPKMKNSFLVARNYPKLSKNPRVWRQFNCTLNLINLHCTRISVLSSIARRDFIDGAINITARSSKITKLINFSLN